MVDNAGSADGATAAFPGVLSIPIQGCAGRLGDVAVGVGGEFYGVGDIRPRVIVYFYMIGSSARCFKFIGSSRLISAIFK